MSMIKEVEFQDEYFELMCVSVTLDGDSPRTYCKAMCTSDSDKWHESIKKELKSMAEMEVWEENEVFPNQHILGTCWVFTVKHNSKGDAIQHKARIVVQGHCQIKGKEFEETFALTPTFTSLCCPFATASKLHWEVQTFDVTTAYLHSGLEEYIYVRPPQGLATGHNKVLQLKKALYILKQAR
ncbi:hypothetical protein O181_072598 [Austropuccinia psidii MF-1]|uniref:Reverse transcriptase Ty1/copia-type domain-containing protein n=1 Tax=Austropuccinia psidii MF-1 TaxID=1389203 RepID=A0A9Q3I9B1_9BASI|nr:hypothetical protein [Austropuccinia psidii MF-1]